jgi:hypothetical protein
MATRSTIALEYADGTVDQIYCHWDGYLSHNGQILFEHYQDPFKLQKMMELGDLSSLHPEIGEKHDFDDRSACDGQCTFYGRDRGETGVSARRFRDFEDYKERHQYEEFEYILRRDGHWYVCQYERGYELLVQQLVEQKSMEDA